MAKIIIPDFGNMDQKARKPKYDSMMDAWDHIRNARLVEGMSPRQIFDKFRPLCRKKFEMKTLSRALIRFGVNDAYRKIQQRVKKDVRFATKKAVKEAKSIARRTTINRERSKLVLEPKAADKIAEVMIARKTAKAEQHFERMDEYIEKSHTVLEKEKPNKNTIGRFMANVDKIDDLARRTYGIADDKPITPHQQQIGILLSINQCGGGNGFGLDVSPSFPEQDG